MHALDPSHTRALFFAIGLLLAAARFFGELARWCNQPPVAGEILAGVLLGPTVLGAYAPNVMDFLFPLQGPSAMALDAVSQLCVVLFLLVAGMEVDLSAVWRQGRSVAVVSLGGMIVPFGIGFMVAWWFPSVLHMQEHIDHLAFSLFFATALSISSLPVIAKILMDLDLYRTDMGVTVISAAVINDLAGWIIFAMIAGMMGPHSINRFPVSYTILMTLVFSLLILVVGRWICDHILYVLETRTNWPGAILSFAFVVTLVSAAAAQWIGIHPVFGSFLVGIAMGDSPHLRERARKSLEDFVSFIFAPLFFATIGLKVNFAQHFDIALVLLVFIIASIGKIFGCGLAARYAGTSWAESWAIGFGLNARGAMQIILGVLALQYGIIQERMFVALVVMAIVTSMVSGSAIRRLVTSRKPYRFIEFLEPGSFVSPMRAESLVEAIRELAHATSTAAGLDARCIENEILKRETIMSTGISNGIAVPHARVDGLARPIVGLGISKKGIDFDASDGEPARLVFLILTPKKDDTAQLELIFDIMKILKDRTVRERLMHSTQYQEVIDLVKDVSKTSNESSEP